MAEFFTSSQATRIAGFRNPMMVDYLHRTGVVTASKRPNPGRGCPRLYTFGDLVLLRAVREVLGAGVSVAKLKTALNVQSAHFKRLTPNSELARYLVTDGSEVLLINDANEIVNLSKGGQLAFAFLIDIRNAQAEVVELSRKYLRSNSRYSAATRKRTPNASSA